MKMKKQILIIAIILGIISLFSCKKKNEVKPSYHVFTNNTYVDEENLTNFNIVNTNLTGSTTYYIFNSNPGKDSVEMYHYVLTNSYRSGTRYKEIKLISLVKYHASMFTYVTATGIVIYKGYNYYPVETIN